MAGWQVTSAYPLTKLRTEGGRTRVQWFLSVGPGGVVQDLLTGAEASGVFLEMM